MVENHCVISDDLFIRFYPVFVTYVELFNLFKLIPDYQTNEATNLLFGSHEEQEKKFKGTHTKDQLVAMKLATATEVAQELLNSLPE